MIGYSKLVRNMECIILSGIDDNQLLPLFERWSDLKASIEVVGEIVMDVSAVHF